jgi:hypothetical protein
MKTTKVCARAANSEKDAMRDYEIMERLFHELIANEDGME